ncbi:hypothetical protein PCANC_18589 [Puccinia coronata f. sp. avenae]|uniref:Uncharacterized protein n=1 Tax=Puccinia coronata f. sp. avenae TaxID=200324 RepID=A0A2N5RWM5_9BASI|nr:hypothetical protein PCANC_25124 [Puccinia coronata f. sp. avenae]PLW26695.1 hypothetical protein PCANC_18589 [Puccinia coronata f. sp. avenae]
MGSTRGNQRLVTSACALVALSGPDPTERICPLTAALLADYKLPLSTHILILPPDRAPRLTSLGAHCWSSWHPNEISNFPPNSHSRNHPHYASSLTKAQAASGHNYHPSASSLNGPSPQWGYPYW